MVLVRALDKPKHGHDTLWSPPTLSLTHPEDRIDVWKVCLVEPLVTDSTTASKTSILSSDETARANRFHFEKDRVHFTRCRSALRNLLAKYVAIPAADIRFEYLTSGKPQLAAGQNPRALQFNVSHSGGVALIAFGSEHRLGVDIEKLRNDTDTTALAERFFSVRERSGLRTLPAELRVPGFFACWTRKEAFLKATGDGLSFPLANFSVTTDPNIDPELEQINGSEDAAKSWHLADLGVGTQYRAALAVEGTFSRLETYAWN